VFAPQELKNLSERGAVGDICLRFFDAAGKPVSTPLNRRIISIELEQLRRVKRVVGVAGGRRKTVAIRGALQGRLVNVLITDAQTATRLVPATLATSRVARPTAFGTPRSGSGSRS
jgi:DNA-binding transcriptional regulator LsrR (DeoR family)